MAQFNDFSLRDLYMALDTQRQEQGLSWSQAAMEINRHNTRVSTRRMATSTITGTRFRAAAEGDGVLQMLRWLKRTPESFIPGFLESGGFDELLPEVLPTQVLRFDTRKLYAALDAQRTERNISWKQLAKEVGMSSSMLTHLSKGGRTSFPTVMRMTRWLGRPTAEFTRGCAR
jgi:DNA-binding phage protein